VPRKKIAASEDTAQRNQRLEDAWRPSRLLGYNHNALAMHLTECDAFTIAESELRRAVWLNPYEAAFMANLAWCLHRQGRSEEAQQCLEQALEQDASNVQVRRISVLMESSPNKGNGSNDNRKDG